MRRFSYVFGLITYICVILFLGLYPKVRVLPFKFDPSFLFHFIAFFLLVLFLIDRTNNRILSFVISVVIGVIIESAQGFVPGRVRSKSDFIFDLLGVILGISVGTKGKDSVFKFVASFGGVGYIPYGPGTLASLLFAAILYWWRSIRLIYVWQIFVILLPISVYVSQKIEDLKGDDPRSCVIDEVMGITMPLLVSCHSLTLYVLSFILFRYFDIWKPLGIRKIERRVKGGIGIVLDDLIAGIFSATIIFLLLKLLPHFGISLK